MNKQFQIKLLQADLGFRGYGAYHVICDILKKETASLPLNYRVLQKLTKIPKKLLKAIIEDYQLFELLDGCFMLLQEDAGDVPAVSPRAKLTTAERSEKCRLSAQARWERYKEEQRKEYEKQKEAVVVVKETKKEEPNKQAPRKQFAKPTVEDVKAYICAMHYKTDPYQFWNFYESKGWFVGKNKMKNWHSAVATWENKNKNLNNKTNGIYNRQDEIDVRLLRGGGEKDYSDWGEDPFFSKINSRDAGVD